MSHFICSIARQPDNKPFVIGLSELDNDLGFNLLKLIIKRFKIRLLVFLYIKIMLLVSVCDSGYNIDYRLSDIASLCHC